MNLASVSCRPTSLCQVVSAIVFSALVFGLAASVRAESNVVQLLLDFESRSEQMWVTAEVIDTQFVIGGDAIVPTGGVQTRSFRASVTNWGSCPGAAVCVPFYFSADLPAGKIQRFREAVVIWNGYGLVQFLEFSRQDALALDHRMEVQQATTRGSSAVVGRNSNSFIRLGDNGENIDTILHEMGHVVGYLHEHQRPDRDEHVIVIEANLQSPFAYEKRLSTPDSAFDSPYDLDSVMHYRQNHFGRPCDEGETDCLFSPVYSSPDNQWELKTMIARNGRTDFGPGYRTPDRLSFGDVAGILDDYYGGLTGRVRFPGANFSRLDLSRYQRNGNEFAGADLSGADLRASDLSRLNLSGADLSGADLTGARLDRVNLSGADLTDAKFDDAHLFGANLSDAAITRTSFLGANLVNASLENATLAQVDFTGIEGGGSTFIGASSFESDVTAADLTCAQITPSRLIFEIPYDFQFAGTDLTGATVDVDLPRWLGTQTCPNGASVQNCFADLVPLAPNRLLGPFDCNGGISVASFVASVL
ncbi:MAG: M12 family metallopeptidase [Myxococcota bacterium]